MSYEEALALPQASIKAERARAVPVAKDGAQRV
jgi:hypothetical protein